ncbi:deoxynucleoside triphosphate triphosphohydrolase SAMHD1-like isoform X1 [Plectropomus leopardus]|uniref:deoxynucleoside triphosphate triphosphohydrolase SAMHD1-like isoform X1 n=1 Tax=Plectropomus leopardus TaxID=160734 RepID=UPI001C4DD4E1|nr:deoxynucleoside triphosphate triphosphohydrolase SAMHD1-like isoform X1 [Plectropomus leopardus]
MAEARQILNEIILENLPELLTATDTERSSEPTEDQIRQWKKTLRLEIASVEELNSSSEERENLHKTISENLPNILREKKPEIEDQISDWKVKMALENVPDEKVFEKILNSSNPGLAEACWILNKIISRKHYKFLGEISNPDPMQTEDVWKQELAEAQPNKLKPGDFEVMFITFDYGMKDEDPIYKMDFYGKDNPEKTSKIFKENVSKLLPVQFSEQLIRVYSRKSDKKSLPIAKEHFASWAQSKCR